MSEKHIINFTNVSFSYKQRKVLEDVNFSLMERESLSIVGPNGGGKSTLLKLILGLIQPDTGTITILGNPPEKARKDIGYMPQFLYCDLSFPVNVLDVVLMGRLGHKFFGFYSKKDKEIALAKMKQLNILDLKDRGFSELSGGQRQRVLIARSLVSNPKILLLDEPTSNVDPIVGSQLYELLKELSKDITILTVSHDLGVVVDSVDRVLCVNRTVKFHATSKLSGENIKDIYSDNIRLIRHDHCCSAEGHLHG